MIVKEAKWKAVAKSIPKGIQNIFEPGFMRLDDELPIRTVAHDGKIPFFILSKSGMGYMFRLNFMNGSSWDEGRRSELLARIEEALSRKSENSDIDYSYAFTMVRKQIEPTSLERYKDAKYPITNIRIDHLQGLASELEVQAMEMYFSITATPSRMMRGTRVGLIRRAKSVIKTEVRYQIECELLEEVVQEFSQRVEEVLAFFGASGFSTSCPMTEADLLIMTRKAWRPNYVQPGEFSKKQKNALTKSLQKGNFITAGDFLLKDLKVDQFGDYWISDGCLNVMLSLNEAPDPNRVFSAYESDKLLNLGIRPGVTKVPFLGVYTVAWTSMSREEGDSIFKRRTGLAQNFKSKGNSIFLQDKAGDLEAAELENQHNEYISGKTDMTKCSVTYQLSIPLEHLSKFVKTEGSDEDIIRNLIRICKTQLDEVGRSTWAVELRTYFPAWLGLVPGSMRVTASVSILPSIYLSLRGALHLVPLFATVSPESEHDPDAWRGSNFFITEQATPFIFDHFSEKNGPAANMCVCGGTGSGKSVTAQLLIMMTEKINPYVMILDFGGGNVGSWTKLRSVMDGVELKFGGVRPPRINPFQLSMSDAIPNKRKKKHIAITLGLDPKSKEVNEMIALVYIHLKENDNPSLSDEIRHDELAQIMPALRKITFDEVKELLKLAPGWCLPGEKGSASIKLVLTYLLAGGASENGPSEMLEHNFRVEDLNEAILSLFEEYRPPKDHPEYWPTLSDYRDALEKLQEDRISGVSQRNRWGSGEIYNYSLLMSRLSNYCVDGLDPFLDGQTNIDIMKKNADGTEGPARFILADMAGISDKKKLALYMVIINDFMSSVLYNLKNGDSGIIIRDEAWLFMKSQIASEYLEADYRLARKYGLSVITIAQQYSDLQNKVLQNNTQVWVVCSLSQGEVALAQVDFKFNEAEKFLFSNKLMGFQAPTSLLSGKPLELFSRIMIVTKAGKFFVKNKISKKENWITSTNRNDTFVFNFVKDTVMRHKSGVEVIEWLTTGQYKNPKNPHHALIAEAIKKAGRKWPKI